MSWSDAAQSATSVREPDPGSGAWPPRRRFCLAAGALGGAAALAGCGFRLRGEASFPFARLFVSGDSRSPFFAELRRTLSGNPALTLAATEKESDAILELSPPNPIDDKQILTLSAGGRVREFQLTKRIVFRIHDGQGGEWLPTSAVVIRREFTFNDSQALAKEAEERVLVQDMQTDAIAQMIRRMQTAKRPG